MRHAAIALFAALALVGLQTGCERGPTGPTSPPQVAMPPPPPPPLPPPVPPAPVEFSLSGTVLDKASRPVADVRIEVVDGPRVGVVAVTNASGQYELPGVFSDTIAVRASKAGYVTLTKTFPFSTPERSGHFDLFFELDSPSVNMAGNYTVTLMADGACSEFPAAARNRTYQATMSPSPYTSNVYEVVLSGVAFFPYNNRILASVAGDFARFVIDPYSDMAVTEVLTATTAVTFWGDASGSVGGSSISMPFRGTLEYCPSALGPQATFPYIRCGAPPVNCSSSNHTLVITRR